jgi:integrase/recombinase XerD
MLATSYPALPAPGPLAEAGSPASASSDAQLVDLWLYGRSPHTRRAYQGDLDTFFAFVGPTPLGMVTLAQLQDYADSLSDLAPASQARRLSAIKSLLGFGARLGYLRFDVGRALRLPKQRDRLSERILSTLDLAKLLLQTAEAIERARTSDQRDRACRDQLMIRLLYAAGVRAEELSRLSWRDCVARGDGGQITVYGKGGKTRAILLPASVWQLLQRTRPSDAADTDPVFSSRNGRLGPREIRKRVKRLCERAGLGSSPSPHWLRHAHATHALERGAPIHLVQQTLGHASLSTTGRYLHARPTDSSARYLDL